VDTLGTGEGLLRPHFFSQPVINRWNSLSQDDIDAATVNSFKSSEENVRWTSSKTECLQVLARQCWIYRECLVIWMMVPGAAALGKLPGKL